VFNVSRFRPIEAMDTCFFKFQNSVSITQCRIAHGNDIFQQNSVLRILVSLVHVSIDE